MNPVFGLILILLLAALAAIIAAKRNRSSLAFLVLALLPVLPLMVLASIGSQGDATAVGIAGFICPLGALIGAMCVPNGTEMAVKHGTHDAYSKCPSCAEPVRREAIKCRYCATDLTTSELSQV